MKRVTVYLLFFLTANFITSCSKNDQKEIKINEIQIIASHNSYKQEIEPALMEIALARDSGSIGLDYGHLPIKGQLDLGLRGLEIDVLHDPDGGRYKKPLGLKLLKEKGIQSEPYDTTDELNAGGLKVLHVPDIDFRSHCLTFKNCLP